MIYTINPRNHEQSIGSATRLVEKKLEMGSTSGGCFTMLVIVIVAIGSIFYGVSNTIEGSQPYEYALEKNQSGRKSR